MRGVRIIVTLLVTLALLSIPISTDAAEYKLNHTKLTMSVGNTKTLKVSPSKSVKITWKSSNSKVVSVSKSGKLTAKKSGTATITATVNKKKLTCKVTVKKAGMQTEAAKLAQTYKKEIQQIVDYTNAYRKKAGKKALKLDKTMTKAACFRSLEMAKNDELSHTRPDGSNCFTIFDYYKIKVTGLRGENVAYSWYTPDAKMICELWYGSDGHKANMLNGKFTKIGVGIAVKGDKIFYTQLFME